MTSRQCSDGTRAATQCERKLSDVPRHQLNPSLHHRAPPLQTIPEIARETKQNSARWRPFGWRLCFDWSASVCDVTIYLDDVTGSWCSFPAMPTSAVRTGRDAAASSATSQLSQIVPRASLWSHLNPIVTPWCWAAYAGSTCSPLSRCSATQLAACAYCFSHRALRSAVCPRTVYRPS